MIKDQPIGIFDSGIGGLTVANSIIQKLPAESVIYFGDTAHMPYGEKSADAIRYYSLKIGKFLLDKNCKMIVIACNSASSAAYHTMLDFFQNRALFVNVVDPLVQYTVGREYKKVGVIATKATIASKMYEQKLKEQQNGLDVFSLATPLLAPMIEEGFVDMKISRSVIESYLSNPGFKDIDALLLACTHYPLIKNEIAEFFNHQVEIIDSTMLVADQVKHLLEKNQLLADAGNQPSHEFFVSDLTASFESATASFFGKSVKLDTNPIW